MNNNQKPQNLTRYFASFKKAEAYQEQLYKTYASVKLIHYPRWEPRGNGTYAWEVK